MGLEKHISKGGAGYVGGFLQLFDWNGKSRKKLSYEKLDLPEGTKQGKQSNENLPGTWFPLNEDDENGGVSSVKGSSDYSCVSSSTDDEGNGTRGPSVVARLMGLDSLPTLSASEPYATPYFEPRSLQEAHYQRKMSEYNGSQNGISENQHNRVDGSNRRFAESRPQKVPSSPIKRFQCETLPPKAAKPHPISHHKLLSPIKSPGFISSKNAADIMEAAAKILEPGYQTDSKGKSLSLGSSSIPIKPHYLRDGPTTTQRPSRLSDTSKRPAESNAVKLLRGQSLNKSWNGSEDTSSYRASPNLGETQSVGSQNKGKSISLAIQAKVNVQRRESLSSGSKNLLIRKEGDEHKPNQPLKNPVTISKSRQNKLSTSGSPSVLRQNNQKQNCPTNKDKLPSKPSVSNQRGRKVLPGDGSLGQNKAFNKVPGSSIIDKKEGSEKADEKEVQLSRTKNFPRKKRAINGNLYSRKSGYIDTILVNRDEKSVQPHSLKQEHLNRAEDSRRKGLDVVSFTFTSPMVKPTTAPRSSDHMEKQNTTNICFVDSSGDRTSTPAEGKGLLSLGLNVIGGDALSILLEQKLRELTTGMESSSCFSPCNTEFHANSAPIVQDFASALTTIGSTPVESHKEPLLRHEKDEWVSRFNSGISVMNGQLFKVNHKLQGGKGIVECHSSSNAHKELDNQHPSPVSIFDASFLNESCNSSDSWESINGCKISSCQVQNFFGLTCPKRTLSMEAETELSDSASSTFTGTVDREHAGLGEFYQMRADKRELRYVKEIIQNAELIFKDLPLSHLHAIIDPSLFERLENLEIRSTNEGNSKDCNLNRRALFDCVSELLNMKCGRYIKGGYKTWAQGVAVVRKKQLLVEIYKEILLWGSMGDWMVDDLVEKDMSSHSGRWLDFEAEAFEIGVEIEGEILWSLVDEAIADML